MSIVATRRKKGNRKQGTYWLMCLPALVWLTFICIIPMSGILIAFKSYEPLLGIFGSPWCGWENFEYVFIMAGSRRAIVNTIIIATSKVILNIIVPLMFALLLNEVRNIKYKKLVQTVTYMPHFISWVILATVICEMFSYDGLFNALTNSKTLWLSSPSFFRYLIIYSDVWKEFGYGSIIYLATLSGINPELYESAAIDGATRFQRLLYITIPQMKDTIILVSILAMGNIMHAGFDQVFNMYNSLVYSTVDIIDTYVYRMGLIQFKYEVATTVGLFKSVISAIMISISYLLAYRFSNYTVL